MKALFPFLVLCWGVLASAQGPLSLHVRSPLAGDTIRTDSIRIEGSAEPGTVLDARGMQITVGENGQFSFNIQSPPQSGLFTMKLAARRGPVTDSVLLPFARMLIPRAHTMNLRILLMVPAEPALKTMAEEFQSALRSLDPTLTWTSSAIYCAEPSCLVQQARQNRQDLVIWIPQPGGAGRPRIQLWTGMRGTLIADLDLSAPAGASAQNFVNAYTQYFSTAFQFRSSDLLTGTPLQGPELSGNLAAAQGPYILYGRNLIPAGKTLVVEPGTILLFYPGMESSLEVQGRLVAAGTPDRPVRFRSAARDERVADWDRILISGSAGSELRETEVTGSQFGVHVENGPLLLQNVVLHGNGERALFVRNADVRVADSRIAGNSGTGIHASAFARLTVERTQIANNKVGIALTGSARADLVSTRVQKNETGLVQLQEAQLSASNSQIQNNQVGLVSADLPEESIALMVIGNQYGLRRAAEAYIASLPDPEFNGDRRLYKMGQRVQPIVAPDTTPRWSWTGNASLTNGYHRIRTADDTLTGEKYSNEFATPGWGSFASFYMLGTRADGKELELSSEISYDSWDRVTLEPVFARYSAPGYAVSLGNMQETAGELYLSGLPLLGIKGQGFWGRNSMETSLFDLTVAAGEVESPLLPGDRTPRVYGDTVTTSTAVAQTLAGYASLGFAPLRRFQMHMGALVADDRLEDPLLRDGASAQYVTTREPLRSSMAVFADGDWLFWPGDIDLNGQIAVGRSDTANVLQERAVNQVFTDAGLPANSLPTLRGMVARPAWIDQASTTELQTVFGTSSLSVSEMRDSLRALRTTALAVQDSLGDRQEAGRTLGLNWGSQDFSLRGEARWQFWKTTLSGKARYVGSRYSSPGSEGLPQNNRELELGWEQDWTDWWNLVLNYRLQVDNAAHGAQTNLFGLGEGTRYGLFQPDADWHNENLLSPTRARYTQQATATQNLKAGSRLDVQMAYQFEYRNQYKPNLLRADLSAAGGIWKDAWFTPRAGQDTLFFTEGDDSIAIDAQRWELYQSLGSSGFLASGLRERLFTHSPRFTATYHMGRSSVRIGGRWTLLRDASVFTRDSLEAVGQLGFDDSTWGKLGYEFHANEYFEQSYPVNATLYFGRISSRTDMTPRFKNYRREERAEMEWRLGERLEIPFRQRHFLWRISGDFRWMESEWIPSGSTRTSKEQEWDLLSEMALRINHSRRFYSEYGVQVEDYRRPDRLESQFRDLSTTLSLYYGF